MVKKKKPTKKTVIKKARKTTPKKKRNQKVSQKKPIKKTLRKPTKKPKKSTSKKKPKKSSLPFTSPKKKIKAKRPLFKTAKKSETHKTPKEKKVTRATRMLQLASNMVAYQMLLSHLLRPISGEPMADGSSLDEMSEQLRFVRKQLLSELGHHPVMSLKISSAYKRTEELWKAHQSISPDNPDIEKIRLEAKEASIKAKETCAAMSDLVAALRCLQ